MKVLINEKLSEHKYKTPEGYLICVDAVLARTGKQSYRKSEIFNTDDNTEIEVDRQPNEVFSEATLASFENKPITVEHPNEDVNSGNIKEYAVGFVRDVHKGYDNGQPVILGTLVIQDAETIEEIENGEHTDLSCGYDCDINDEENPQQRNIRGNHVALCQCGRAGNARIVDSCKIKDNEKDAIMDYLFSKKYNISQQRATSKSTGDNIIIYTATNNKLGKGIQFSYNTKTDKIEVILYKDMFGMSKRLNNLSEIKAVIDSKNFNDAQDYVINFRNDYEGFREKTFVNANSAIDALKKFAKEVALRGWGTRNITIISISPNDGYIRLYGNLYDLLKSKDFNDSVKEPNPTYRSVWLKVKEYVKYHYNFNYKKEFNDLMNYLNNQYAGSIDEDAVYRILRDLNEKGYIVFVKDSEEKENVIDDFENGIIKGDYMKITDSMKKDELYSLQELREMRIDNYRGVDLYKIHGQYSTNPNTSNRRFNTIEQVKEYIDNGFRDSIKDDKSVKTSSGEIHAFISGNKYKVSVWNKNNLDYDDFRNISNKYGVEVYKSRIGNDYIDIISSDKDRIYKAFAEVNPRYPVGSWQILDSIKDVSEEEIKEYMKKTGFSYIDAKRALEEDNSDFVEKMRRSYYDEETPYEEVTENLEKNYDNFVEDDDISSLPDRIEKEKFNELYYKLRNKFENKWNYRVSTYGDKFKIEIEKAVGAVNGTYGPVGGKWKTVKTIYSKDSEKNINDQSDLSLLKEYFNERQPNKKMELRNKLKSMNYREGVSGVNSRELMWVELNGKKYEVKNLSSVKPLDSIKDSYIIQSKYNTENYLQEDNHFGMNKKFAQKFNSYEEAAKKANILSSDWDKHMNIIKDSKTSTKLSTIVKLVKAIKTCKDSVETMSEWIKKINGVSVEAAILKHPKGYTFRSSIIREDRDFNSYDYAVEYAKALNYKRK